jgi:hypothetical protein
MDLWRYSVMKGAVLCIVLNARQLKQALECGRGGGGRPVVTE